MAHLMESISDFNWRMLSAKKVNDGTAANKGNELTVSAIANCQIRYLAENRWNKFTTTH